MLGAGVVGGVVIARRLVLLLGVVLVMGTLAEGLILGALAALASYVFGWGC